MIAALLTPRVRPAWRLLLGLLLAVISSLLILYAAYIVVLEPVARLRAAGAEVHFLPMQQLRTLPSVRYQAGYLARFPGTVIRMAGDERDAPIAGGDQVPHHRECAAVVVDAVTGSTA